MYRANQHQNQNHLLVLLLLPPVLALPILRVVLLNFPTLPVLWVLLRLA
jgi:hypothetical protein